MRPLIVIRPEPGNAATVAAAGAMGLNAHGVPLQRVEAADWTVPAGPFDGLLIGSANAFRFGGAGMASLRHLPVYAVGETTANAAKDAGFDVAMTGKGGLQNVLDALSFAGATKLLRVGGAERVPLSPPRHVEIADVVAYRLAPREPSADELALLARPACIAIHSASAMRRLDAVFDHYGLDRAVHSLAVLGPRIAPDPPVAWTQFAVASTPDDASLLAVVRQMCHETD